jgi:hypothetical protein
MGDGILIYFGYPHAHEDDAERAVRCALSSVEAVSALKIGKKLEARVGIATGMGNAAMALAMDQHRVHGTAAIVDRDVTDDIDDAGLRIDLHFRAARHTPSAAPRATACYPSRAFVLLFFCAADTRAGGQRSTPRLLRPVSDRRQRIGCGFRGKSPANPR